MPRLAGPVPNPSFDELLEALPDALVGVDRAGLIVLANGNAEELFGYPRDELLGQPLEMLVPAPARSLHLKQRRAYARSPRPRPLHSGLKLSGLRRDGSEFPADIGLSMINTAEGPLVVAAIRDISEQLAAEAARERLQAQAERERLERRLQQSQRLESLGQLAGGVAHDFNNLLGVILNYAAFVGEEIAARASADSGGGAGWEDLRADLDEIKRAAERASRLTHQLLAFGRRDVAQPRRLNLNAVVGDVHRLLERTLGEHIELVTELADDLWRVTADPGQLEQVLVNLAVNARDAMPGGGRLVVQTSNEVVDTAIVERRPALTPGEFVRLRVGDTGTGMDREVIEHAFEPFFTTKPKGVGTGLGLASVYGIVAQAGGDVAIYSEGGVGTTVSILLPATDTGAPAVPADKAEPQAHRHSGETVLVVEDEDAMRELTRRILTRNGYEVLLARSGVEAIELVRAREEPIDLLVTDVVMPQMLGKEVAEQIAALRPDVAVLYMSGYAQPVLASTGTLDRGVTLIEKPFSEGRLLEKVREVLDGDR